MKELEARLKKLFGLTDFATKDIAKDLEAIVRKQIASEIDVNTMVAKFKDDFIGEFDSATINKVADDIAKFYKQGIADTIKAIKVE